MKNSNGESSQTQPSSTPTHDPVLSPDHYTSGSIECIDAIKASMSPEAYLGFLKGQVQKYLWRYEKKDPAKSLQDLRKGRFYLDALINEVSE